MVVTSAIRQLSALPVPIAYRLAEVSEALQPSDFASVYRERRRFAFPLSNRIRSDPMFQAWQAEDPTVIDAAQTDTAEELERRMRACFSVLSGLVERAGDRLFAYAPKFTLPSREHYAHPTLSRLAFMTRYEQLLGYLATRTARTAPRIERLESGTALRVRLLELASDGRNPRWRAELAPESRHVLVERDGFCGWLVCEDTPEGDREQMRFMDYQYRRAFWIPKGIAVAYAEVAEVDSARAQLELAFTLGRDTPDLEAGKHYLLHPRFTDWNSEKVLEGLSLLDGQQPCAFAALVDDPHGALARRVRPAPLASKEGLQSAVEVFGFTASQATALERILDHSFQLVWGPPGTGKTHFLGMFICALAQAKASEGEGLSVLVSGFTHAAIENCLAKVAELTTAFQDHLPQLQLTKLDGWRGQARPASVQDLSADPRQSPAASEFQVVGGTVYAIHKHLDDPFDLVILDEGSQLRVAEASIPLSRVHERGRLVIAGDDKQLGPILAGAYPEPVPEAPALFSSVFECLRAPDVERGAYTSQLLECFRLNETLCRFPAETIYGSAFEPASQPIAEQRLRIAQQFPEGPDWLEFCLDPAFPLVLLILEGVPALAENRQEAQLVSDLAVALRERLLDEDGQSFTSDRAFWERGLFVVSPHHAQIRAIRGFLAERRAWQHPPFVDTVEKMQGQESQAVIVSYGVADSDYALREGEFIYSLNRLNVSITRARAKALVCLPAPLLSPPITAFGRDDVLEGLDLMLRLRDFAITHGEEQIHELPDGPAGARLRLIRARYAEG